MPGSPCQFIDQVPEYTARDGRIYIRMGEHCLAMPINVFEIGCARGKAAIAVWRSEMPAGQVVPFSLRAGS
jgi:hypothetical protein